MRAPTTSCCRKSRTAPSRVLRRTRSRRTESRSAHARVELVHERDDDRRIRPAPQVGEAQVAFRAYRLPEENTNFSLNVELEVALKSTGDNPIWICVTTEDGFQAWSSPIYVFNKDA